MSALFWLAGNAEGQQLLLQSQGLVDKITPDGLNQIITAGPYHGASAIFMLAKTVEGRQLLLQSPRLVEKITPEALNHIISSGAYPGQSALFWLVNNPDGNSPNKQEILKQLLLQQ